MSVIKSKTVHQCSLFNSAVLPMTDLLLITIYTDLVLYIGEDLCPAITGIFLVWLLQIGSRRVSHNDSSKILSNIANLLLLCLKYTETQ